MIPLYKLEKLPRTQRLRKIAKIFTMAEKRLCLHEAASSAGSADKIYTAAEFVFFADAVKLLAADKQFPPDTQKMLLETADIFNACIQDAPDDGQLRRALNSVKHLLLTATGRDQADWDFTGNDGKLDPAGRRIFRGMYVYLEDIVPWERQELFAAAAPSVNFQSEGQEYPVFALETGGIPLAEFSFPRCGLLIAGSEELGVSPNALAAADASLGRVSIPCYGAKASLNVSVAFGIAMNAWARALNP